MGILEDENERVGFVEIDKSCAFANLLDLHLNSILAHRSDYEFIYFRQVARRELSAKQKRHGAFRSSILGYGRRSEFAE